MNFSELKPIQFVPKNTNELLKKFRKGTYELEKKLPNEDTDITKIVNIFLDENPRYKKTCNIISKSLEGRKFELEPHIVKYEVEHLNSFDHCQKIAKRFKEAFIRPIDAVNGVLYKYEMYIPIPQEILNYRNAEMVLKEHSAIVYQLLETFSNYLYDVKPTSIVGRVCGWEGSWLSYTISAKDDKKVFWGTPLADAPYKDYQPFMVVPNGEFVIIESDFTNLCKAQLKEIKSQINERIDIMNKPFKRLPVIEVDASWIVARSINTNTIQRNITAPQLAHDFGGQIPIVAVCEDKLEGVDLLKVIAETEMYAQPSIKFSPQLVKKYTMQIKS